MTESAMDLLAREFIQVWSAGNLHLLDELADPDIVVDYAHFDRPIRGVDTFRAALEQTFRHFPDLVTTTRTVLVDGHRAAVEWTYGGTHTQGDLFGVAAAGARVSVRGVTLYRAEHGRIVEERGVADLVSLMTQLGAL